MKLLFDQNLSFSLVRSLQDVFPESAHVRDFGLETADDATVWNFAKEKGFAIVSKDSDFRQRSFLEGAPPKVIWLNVGNCSTTRIEALLRQFVIQVIAFDRDQSASFLALG